MLLGCFDLFENSIHNVAPQEEVANLWHSRNQKQMLAFGHLQCMQLKTIGMNFSMFLYHAPT
jgi:hypothetical protein